MDDQNPLLPDHNDSQHVSAIGEWWFYTGGLKLSQTMSESCMVMSAVPFSGIPQRSPSTCSINKTFSRHRGELPKGYVYLMKKETLLQPSAEKRRILRPAS
ncbi:hypothetical protein OUZ56_022922 [Daphnia magna]|uniref:Uncharacterized protein n=1 Tax=Daphnia magna TaxID=35525 RepID=A0ABR0AXW0_9CRUS|nr:hypothetical protein OUZ56_022922 [Daphnia magna]